jgi:hypothetical protein
MNEIRIDAPSNPLIHMVPQKRCGGVGLKLETNLNEATVVAKEVFLDLCT